jgi:hypothetical protein
MGKGKPSQPPWPACARFLPAQHAEAQLDFAPRLAHSSPHAPAQRAPHHRFPEAHSAPPSRAAQRPPLATPAPRPARLGSPSRSRPSAHCAASPAHPLGPAGALAQPSTRPSFPRRASWPNCVAHAARSRAGAPAQPPLISWPPG